MLRPAFLLLSFVFVVFGVGYIGAMQTNPTTQPVSIAPDQAALAVQMACIYGHVESACETFKHVYEHPNMRYKIVPHEDSLAAQMACVYGHVESACETFKRDYEHPNVRYTLVPQDDGLAVQMACIYGHVESACETFKRDYERKAKVIGL
jgi:hypothetical protein